MIWKSDSPSHPVASLVGAHDNSETRTCPAMELRHLHRFNLCNQTICSQCQCLRKQLLWEESGKEVITCCPSMGTRLQTPTSTTVRVSRVHRILHQNQIAARTEIYFKFLGTKPTIKEWLLEPSVGPKKGRVRCNLLPIPLDRTVSAGKNHHSIWSEGLHTGWKSLLFTQGVLLCTIPCGTDNRNFQTLSHT